MRKRLKELRNFLKLSQQEFAKKLGISQTFLSAIERGEKEHFSTDLILALKNLNVNVDWFLTGKGVMFHKSGDDPPLVNIPDPTGDLAAAVRLLAEMPPEKRKDCLNYIQDKKLLLDLQREIEKIKAG